ncbi:MAG TPA: sigma-70 family RNA polymerase sigma factor [Acidobacteriota bacterium]|jgi:RNA polymerase sigma-70 factor (ECF subfamily)|nr:sigma-70 family RNA polymerase sigma factor [Acidobacteriota bacterium]HNR37449.1 sigma-70 family RNA polymerase sigma factor [Acidobacteriota bacterium]HNT99644.1 sigma-70 family RNA polymerase sigma factor [Acidobacteriota bacterium]HPB27086.1 sigma-70 family RNA polymerase sigma factor [Acidobacteriota bacterium]HQO24885.1 sigma-70 family RNA polymerase sigma factor [Acidobacteriota bacterium]
MDADAQLMERVRDGDTASFDLLMDRYRRPVINFVYRMVRDAAAAEEIAQDVFVQIYLARKRYTASARFSTWLFKVATNTTLKHIRKHRRVVRESELATETRERFLDLLTAGENDGAHESLERKELGLLVQQALVALPDKEKVALTLRKYEGCSYQEIADIMKCSVAAIKTHIHRGKLRLRETLLRAESRLDPTATD